MQLVAGIAVAGIERSDLIWTNRYALVRICAPERLLIKEPLPTGLTFSHTRVPIWSPHGKRHVGAQLAHSADRCLWTRGNAFAGARVPERAASVWVPLGAGHAGGSFLVQGHVIGTRVHACLQCRTEV